MKTWLLLSTALLLAATAVSLSACGGGDEEQSSTAEKAGRISTSATWQKTNEARQGSQHDAGSKQNSGRAKSGSDASGDPVPGTKSVAPGVPVIREGDESIQTFGVEGQTDQRSQAIAALKAYLGAILSGEWVRACAATSEEFKQQLATLIARARIRDDAKKPEGCVATLPVLFADLPRAALRATAPVNEVLSFRVQDEYAYMIFRGAEGAVKFIAMANDGGRWKVNVLTPAGFTAGARE